MASTTHELRNGSAVPVNSAQALPPALENPLLSMDSTSKSCGNDAGERCLRYMLVGKGEDPIYTQMTPSCSIIQGIKGMFHCMASTLAKARALVHHHHHSTSITVAGEKCLRSWHVDLELPSKSCCCSFRMNIYFSCNHFCTCTSWAMNVH